MSGIGTGFRFQHSPGVFAGGLPAAEHVAERADPALLVQTPERRTGAAVLLGFFNQILRLRGGRDRSWL